MNKRVTSREHILEHATRLALEQGIDYISIRKVAKDCDIAIGSIYNYFPNKDALTKAVAESFWDTILLQQEEIYHEKMAFTDFMNQYYRFLYGRLKKYNRTWLMEMNAAGSLQGDEAEGFRDAKKLMRKALDQDNNVKDQIWNMELNKDVFVDYVFENLLALLRAGESNCRFFLFLIEHLLYENN